MNEASEIDDEYDEDRELGPSLALPPLYVLSSAVYCPECGQAQHVYTLGCAAWQWSCNPDPPEAPMVK